MAPSPVPTRPIVHELVVMPNGSALSAKEAAEQLKESNVSDRDQRRSMMQMVQMFGGGVVAHRRFSFRESLRQRITSVQWQSIILVTALADCSMLIVDLTSTDGENLDTHVGRSVFTITIIVLLVFAVDLALRLYTYRRLFFCGPSSLWNWFDLLVLVGGCIAFGALADLATSAEYATTGIAVARGTRAVRGIVSALRWLRTVRVVQGLVKVGRGTGMAARRITGENKRRVVDLEHGFDLDLAEIVDGRLIAMSVPATGWRRLFRNPIGEVVRFFETRHAAQGYTIINACPELPYPAEKFRSGEVVRFDVQDHTPPTMAQFVAFLDLVLRLPPGRVVAVHCRGGKGRTGSFCCAWLLLQGVAQDAQDALATFALERTELGKGKKKLQGVDTPSQQRYVHQIDALLRARGLLDADPNAAERARAAARASADPIAPPAAPPLRLRSLRLDGWFAVAPGTPLVCAVHAADAAQVGGRSGLVRSWSAAVWADASGGARFELGGVEVQGDVRVSVFSLEKLNKARAKRAKKLGISLQQSRLPFDAAAEGPWDDGAPVEVDLGGGGARTAAAPSNEKRVIAGKEAGCLFFFLFHSGFVPALGPDGSGTLRVPVHQCDKAFKNKHGEYFESGVATLGFDADTDSYNGLEVDMFDASQRDLAESTIGLSMTGSEQV